MNPDTSKAAWDVIREVFTAKGYTVAPYDDTLRAMAEHELVPTYLSGVTATGDPTAITWWGAGSGTPEAIKAMCQDLDVSRIITVFPTADDLAAKHQQATGNSAAIINDTLTGLISREKSIAVSLTAAAWGWQTGRCVWEASMKFTPEVKPLYEFTKVFGEARARSMSGVGALPTLFNDGVVSIFSEFFQRDMTVYGSWCTTTPMTPVTGTVQKNKHGHLDGISLTWKASGDARVTGYAIYRACDDDLFPPYATATTHDTWYLDRSVEQESPSICRYVVVPLIADSVEGNASPVTVVKLGE